MKIITCIKQVPASSKVEIDPITGVLIRDGSNVKMNPFDLFALEASFIIKELTKGDVHAVTMGPFSAIEVLKEALYMGADQATLISDRRFAGADVLATSYTLFQLIKSIGDYDVIVCGKQTTDGDTAQVGPEVAEFLKIPHIPYVKEIIEVKENSIVVYSSYDDYDEIVEVKTPCLITIEKDANTPRLPSFKRKLLVKDYKINIKTLKDLEDENPGNYGLTGSPTQVEEMFPPKRKTETELFDLNKKDSAKKIIEILKENRYM